jgi:uncharacterized protein YndB with AHSA1/START domain
MVDEMDKVFKALGDRTRRYVLDTLHDRNGQTLNELCRQLDMARQSTTQHLRVLEDASLISTVWRGREKLHYLNPVPVHQIQQRWIEKFERPRLTTLSKVKKRAEERYMNDKPAFVYVTYIRSTPEQVWHALTDADLTADYWGHSNVSDWQQGSRWEHLRTDGSGIVDVTGRVLEADPPYGLVMTFEEPNDNSARPTTVRFTIEPYHEIVRLTVTHEGLPDENAVHAASHGWSAVLANLKSLLETGHVLPQAPWEMHTGLRATQMAKNDSP